MKSPSSTSSDDTESYLEDTNNHNLRSVLLIQFQPQFKTLIILGICLSYICCLIDATFAFSMNVEDIPYLYKATSMGLILFLDAIYFLDALLMTAFKNVDWPEIKHVYRERSSICLVLDYISIVPLDGIYFSLAEANMKTFFALRLRYALRIYRLFTVITQARSRVGSNQLKFHLIKFFIALGMIEVTTTCVSYYNYCTASNSSTMSCISENYKIFLMLMYHKSGLHTSRVFPDSFPRHFLELLWAMTANIFTFLLISGFVIPIFTSAIIERIKNRCLCKHRELFFGIKLKLMGVRDLLISSAVKQFFSVYWKQRKGITTNNYTGIVPEITTKELKLDVTWDAFKHSHLFRDAEVYFLRYLSQFVDRKVMLPGEVIYKRNCFKSRMVYVRSGVIQILSEEDSETPILSFSVGTCLGESTLFIDYPSPYSVVCQTYCELSFFERKNFIKVCNRYPQQYRLLRKSIQKRHADTHEYFKLGRFLKQTYNSCEKTKFITSKWLKMTLHKLMLKNEEDVKHYESSMHLEDRLVADSFENVVFCGDYLDSLAPVEDVAIFSDKVFLRTTCPIVLQPDSVIVEMWRKAVAMLVLAFAFFYPYYAVFDPTPTTTYYIVTYAITYIWIMDVYVSASTAIKTRDVYATEIRNIVVSKLGTVDFFVDIMAAVPCELLYAIVSRDVSSQVYLLFQANRILKLKKMSTVFNELSNESQTLTANYLKYIICTALLTYYSAAALYLQVCFEYQCLSTSPFLILMRRISSGSILDTIILSIFITSQKVTGYSLGISDDGDYEPYYIFFILLDAICTIFYVFFLSYISATECLHNHTKLKLQELVANSQMIMKDMQITDSLYRRIAQQFRTELLYSGGGDLLNVLSASTLPMPIPLRKQITFVARKDHIKRIPLFQEQSDEIISSLCYFAKATVIGPGVIVSYYGEIGKEMHVIVSGYCKAVTNLNVVNVIGPYDSFGVLETCLQLAMANTVSTLSYCKVLTISYDSLQAAFVSYPEVYKELDDVVLNSVGHNLIHYKFHEETFEIVDNVLSHDEEKSFKNFGYRIAEDTKEHEDYYSYFSKYGGFGGIRYLLLRHTITSYGHFLKYWELSRCIFAFMTNFVIFIPLTIAPHYILYILDATAWVDLYLRHHIGYFNEKNIEVTHPLKTALHYWRHAFTLDLLGVLPFELILPGIWHISMHSRLTLFMKLNRLLQTYRIFVGIWTFTTESIVPLPKWALLRFIPIILILINIYGSLVIAFSCEFGPNIEASPLFTKNVRCARDSWLARSKFTKPLTPFRTYLYGLYFATTATTCIGLGGFAMQSITEVVALLAINMTGYLFFIYITCKTVASHLISNADLTSYQEAMKNLVNFLSYRRIDVNLKKEVIEHFEYKWQKKRGKDIRQRITGFHSALQQDILYDIYGKVMQQSTIFEKANKYFIRNVLLDFKHEIFLKRGIITRVNDIHGMIYFVYKGKVDVLGPDYNRLLTLPVGSLFGNLDNCEVIRQTLTMVAKGHVELLSITSIEFHRNLKGYRQLNNEFSKLTVINTDFLIGGPVEREEIPISQHTSDNTTPKSVNTCCTCTIPQYLKQVHKPSKSRRIWDIAFLAIVCFAGFSLELYQKVVEEYVWYLITTLYMLDVAFLFNMYLKFHTAYENEYGLLVTDIQMIAKRYLNSRFGFGLDLICALPFEIFSLFFLYSKHFGDVWNYTRMNRFLRFIFVIHFFYKRQQKLNINVYMRRVLFVFIWIFFLLQLLSALGIYINCIDPNFNLTLLVECETKHWSSLKRFKVYFKHFYTTILSFTVTSTNFYYPDAEIVIIFTILLLITFKLMNIVLISETCTALQMSRHNKMLYEERFKNLQTNMTRDCVSLPLLRRVKKYVRLLWNQSGGEQFPMLLEEAPYYLREAVLNSMFGYHIRNHSVFKKCHVDLVRQMTAQLRPRTFFTGDYIVFVNDIDECMYFIHEGSVDVLSKDTLHSEKIEKTLFEEDMFGLEQGMYPNCSHEYTYRANRRTVVLLLWRNTWITMLSFYPASKILIYDETRNET